MASTKKGEDQMRSAAHRVATPVQEQEPTRQVSLLELMLRALPFVCFLALTYYARVESKDSGLWLVFLQVILLMASILAWIRMSPKAHR